MAIASRLKFNTDLIDNYLWHAVRAFFENGGKRLYVRGPTARRRAT